MNFVKNLFLVVGISCIGSISYAKSVDYLYEDAYSLEAPIEVRKLADEAAERIGFEQPFEVVAPKKPGIQINPLNKFIAVARNQLSQNIFLMINPEWFATLTKDEQLFLISRSLMQSVPQGILFYIIKYLPYLFALCGILILFLLYVLFRKTIFSSKKWWVSLLSAVIVSNILSLFLINPILQPKVTMLLGKRFDRQCLHFVVEKLGKKDAAIHALEKYDAGIQAEFDNGATVLAPYVGLFKSYADELRA